MHTQEDLSKYSQSFKLGMLLAILEYHGDVEPITEHYHLRHANSKSVLSLFTEAIYQANSNGHRESIEKLVVSIGDVPRIVDASQQKEFVDGYRTECVLQTPFPGYLPRQCKVYQKIEA